MQLIFWPLGVPEVYLQPQVVSKAACPHAEVTDGHAQVNVGHFVVFLVDYGRLTCSIPATRALREIRWVNTAIWNEQLELDIRRHPCGREVSCRQTYGGSGWQAGP